MKKNPLDNLSSKNQINIIYFFIGVLSVISFFDSRNKISTSAYVSALFILFILLFNLLKTNKLNKDAVIKIPGFFGLLYFLNDIILTFTPKVFLLNRLLLNIPITQFNLELIGTVYLIALNLFSQKLYFHFIKNHSIENRSKDIIIESSLVLLIQALLSFFLVTFSILLLSFPKLVLNFITKI